MSCARRRPRAGVMGEGAGSVIPVRYSVQSARESAGRGVHGIEVVVSSTRNRPQRRPQQKASPAIGASSSAAAPATPSMPGRPDVVPLIEAIETERNSRVLTYYLSPGRANMAMDAIRPFEEQLLEMGHQPRIDLWIFSLGGQTEMPWRLVQTI